MGSEFIQKKENEDRINLHLDKGSLVRRIIGLFSSSSFILSKLTTSFPFQNPLSSIPSSSSHTFTLHSLTISSSTLLSRAALFTRSNYLSLSSISSFFCSKIKSTPRRLKDTSKIIKAITTTTAKMMRVSVLVLAAWIQKGLILSLSLPFLDGQSEMERWAKRVTRNCLVIADFSPKWRFSIWKIAGHLWVHPMYRCGFQCKLELLSWMEERGFWKEKEEVNWRESGGREETYNPAYKRTFVKIQIYSVFIFLFLYEFRAHLTSKPST